MGASPGIYIAVVFVIVIVLCIIIPCCMKERCLRSQTFYQWDHAAEIDRYRQEQERQEVSVTAPPRVHLRANDNEAQLPDYELPPYLKNDSSPKYVDPVQGSSINR